MRRDPGFRRPNEARAFAEGRRLRERAERDRRGHHARHHPRDHRLDHRRGRGAVRRTHPVLVLLAVPTVLMAGVGISAMILGLMMIGIFVALNALPLLVAGGVTFVLVRRRVRRNRALRRAAAAGTAPIPARPAAPPRPDLVWAHAHQRFHRLRAEYAAYECDPMRVLRLPALSDVTVPSTARFIDAFAETQALETDRYPGPDLGNRFTTAVDRAERAWKAAKDAAERIRLSKLTPAERTTVERVIKLLTTARDTDSEPERLAAYTRARTELAKLDQAGVLHVPLPAQAALDEAARAQLPATAEPADVPAPRAAAERPAKDLA